MMLLAPAARSHAHLGSGFTTPVGRGDGGSRQHVAAVFDRDLSLVSQAIFLVVGFVRRRAGAPSSSWEITAHVR